jgi:hypothetical protein
MPTKNSSENEKVRLNFEVTSDLKRDLKDLQERTKSVTVAEVFRKALSLLDMVTNHIQSGGTVSLKYKDGREEAVRFL